MSLFKVLLVEDSPDIRDSLKGMLCEVERKLTTKKQLFELLEAKDLVDGIIKLESAQNRKFDFLIVDLKMPYFSSMGRTGTEIRERLKEQSYNEIISKLVGLKVRGENESKEWITECCSGKVYDDAGLWFIVYAIKYRKYPLSSFIPYTAHVVMLKPFMVEGVSLGIDIFNKMEGVQNAIPDIIDKSGANQVLRYFSGKVEFFDLCNYLRVKNEAQLRNFVVEVGDKEYPVTLFLPFRFSNSDFNGVASLLLPKIIGELRILYEKIDEPIGHVLLGQYDEKKVSEGWLFPQEPTFPEGVKSSIGRELKWRIPAIFNNEFRKKSYGFWFANLKECITLYLYMRNPLLLFADLYLTYKDKIVLENSSGNLLKGFQSYSSKLDLDKMIEYKDDERFGERRGGKFYPYFWIDPVLFRDIFINLAANIRAGEKGKIGLFIGNNSALVINFSHIKKNKTLTDEEVGKLRKVVLDFTREKGYEKLRGMIARLRQIDINCIIGYRANSTKVLDVLMEKEKTLKGFIKNHEYLKYEFEIKRSRL